MGEFGLAKQWRRTEEISLANDNLHVIFLLGNDSSVPSITVLLPIIYKLRAQLQNHSFEIGLKLHL